MGATKPRVLVAGSGFFGLTIARLIAEDNIADVKVVEKRSHIGGNAYSEIDASTGVDVHKYGSHIFHTSNEDVWSWVNQFSNFHPYEHRVYANSGGKLYSLPVSLLTLSQLYERHITPEEAGEIIPGLSKVISKKGKSFEAMAIETIGPEVYRAFFEGYTKKQWQTDPKDLPGEVFGRLPVRANLDSRYFSDTYQAMPSGGYGALFEKLADHKRINLQTQADFFAQELGEFDLVIYTGPLDAYFNYSHGQLSWRTLDFEFETKNIDDFQGTSVINYSDIEVPYTRVHEFKHFMHPELRPRGKTVIAREYSRWADPVMDEPYYPVNSASDKKLLEKYRALTKKEKGVIFGGRLGTYKYLDMHMAIASALTGYRNTVRPAIQR